MTDKHTNTTINGSTTAVYNTANNKLATNNNNTTYTAVSINATTHQCIGCVTRKLPAL